MVLDTHTEVCQGAETGSCSTGSMLLDDLEMHLDELEAAGPAALADAESIRRVHRLETRLGAIKTAAVAQFDASGDWANDGAQTTSAWLATSCHLSRGEARKEVRLARVLKSLPAAAEAFRAGDISATHLNALAKLCKGRTKEALERDEEMLVELAKTLRFEEFMAALLYWEQLADPDGTEESAEQQRNRRDVYLTPSVSGMYLGQMTLDPISGAIVSDELERLERVMFRADWAEAKERLGRRPTLPDLERTPAQRRADALVEMATRSGSTPPDAQRPAPLFNALVDWPTLSGRVCELAQGTPITPGSLLPWLEFADFERAVFGPGTRVEISPLSRLFTGATRRALMLRDQECTHEFCDVRGGRCQVDHIIPHAYGGQTEQENGRLLCGFHNRLRNQRPPPDG
jgi:Domain of unknown function (DUF222)/HNH endonuclease